MTPPAKPRRRPPTRGGKKRASTAEVSLELVVSVHETTRAAGVRAREVLAELGCTVTPEEGADQVARRCAGGSPPDVVLSAFPGGAPIMRALADCSGGRPVVIASLAAPATTAVGRCDKAGADLFVIRPHGVESLATALRAASMVQRERGKAAALSASEEMLRERLTRYGQADAETGFQHFDFFRQILVMELKRAKRFGYPLAACVIAIDPWSGAEPPVEVLRVVRVRVASVVAACLRDIDLRVDLEQDRFLAFLPYTDLAGAQEVGKRVSGAVAGFAAELRHDHGYKMSVSIGIAATKPGKAVSFAKLMRDANAAVRASQLKGGGRVLVRK